MPRSKKIDPRSMKQLNKQMILHYLIENGPASRMELVRRTKLANSAIWRITEELLDEEFIEQKEYFIKTNTKKAAVYGPTKSFAASFIVDVQVLQTTVALGFLDGSWEILDVFPTNGFDEFSRKVCHTLELESSDNRVRKDRTKIIFSLPGIVDDQKCELLYAPNLKWHDVDFKRCFGKYGFEIFADNDSNLSLLGESFFAKDIESSASAFFLYLGEGIGGAVLIDGKIFKGKNFAAGELGHSILNVDDSAIEVEELLSLSKVVGKFEELSNVSARGNLRERFERLVEAWHSGNKFACEVVDEFLKNFSILLKNIGYFINPQIIILGGAVNNIWETFGTRIEKQLSDMDKYGFLNGIKFRDTIFKNISPSLPGSNVAAIHRILETISSIQ